jgi:LysM repeat protein
MKIGFAWIYHRILISLTLASILAGAFAGNGTAAAIKCAAEHTVVKNESINRIARLYGVSVAKIAKANNIPFPYTLIVGDVLCIPAAPAVVKGSWNAARLQNNRVLISLFSVPKGDYVIRVSGGPFGDRDRVGVITAEKGVVSKTFKLPSVYEKYHPINVCLKSTATDSLVCRTLP